MATFAILDPRPTAEAQIANEKVFSLGQVFGVEVTVPTLAKRCIANLDPQHTDDRGMAAIEAALTCQLPPDKATLATVRPDLDSFGAMAVLLIRYQPGWGLNNRALERVASVARSDKAHGRWPGPKPLPLPGEPLDRRDPDKELQLGMAKIVSDHRLSVFDRVDRMAQWLMHGSCDGMKEAYTAVLHERDEAIAASQAELDGCMAAVESTHRGAMGLGYCLAPVVVAVNPAFQQGPGEPHKKFTVAQFGPGYVELGSVKDELNAIEPGWGGSPTILGSPQGVSSKLTFQQVAEVVQRHLKYDSWCADCGTIGYGVGFYACSECRTLLCASCVDVHQMKGHFVSQ